jgi:uncharacterized protein (TIGR02246 family)
MKTRLLGALLGLAIIFAVPTFAQQNDVADPQTTQKILALLKAWDEACIKHDPAGIAVCYTHDAVFVTPQGPLFGPEAIQKFYTDVFQQWHPKDSGGTLDGNVFHLIGTAGNEAWATGEWNETGQGKNGEPVTIKGYWSNIYVREGDDWKIRVDTWNMTPAATPSPTTTPSSQ